MIEYVWIDGDGGIRGKTKVLPQPVNNIEEIPIWNFDGSSTKQAEGKYSDVFLFPRRIYQDPFRDHHHLMVLCDCYDDYNGQ